MEALTTQCMCVLLKEELTMEKLEGVLSSFSISSRQPAKELEAPYQYSGPSVLLPFRPEVNGMVWVEVVNHPWPDRMGDLKGDDILSVSWAMGLFGPHTHRGSLRRAGENSLHWMPGQTISRDHTGYVLILGGYAFDTGKTPMIKPPDYDPGPELEFMTEVSLAVLDLPQALCYFNPGGEILLNREGVKNRLEYSRANDSLPIDAWINCRLFRTEMEWLVVDTVGNRQLGVSEMEACFSRRYDWDEVSLFVRSATWHFYQNGETLKDGDLADGPGGISWKAHRLEKSLAEPARAVIRWLPQDRVPVPAPFRKK